MTTDTAAIDSRNIEWWEAQERLLSRAVPEYEALGRHDDARELRLTLDEVREHLAWKRQRDEDAAIELGG
jgi:hypothetical protein